MKYPMCTALKLQPQDTVRLGHMNVLVTDVAPDTNDTLLVSYLPAHYPLDHEPFATTVTMRRKFRVVHRPRFSN